MKMIILIISIFLMFLLVPLVSATLQNETLYCFQGFNSDGSWIDWVNGTNATPIGNVGNTSDGCPLSFPSCAVFDGADDYFEAKPDVITNLTQGGMIAIIQGNDTDDYGAILTVSRPASNENNLMVLAYDTSINYNRLVWDILDTDLNRQSWGSPANSIQLQKDYHLFFQSDGGYGTNYTWFINGSNQTFDTDLGGQGYKDGTFYNMSKIVSSNSYNTSTIGVSRDLITGSTTRVRYDFKGKMSMLLVLNKSINKEKLNETFTPTVQNCTQILSKNTPANLPTISIGINATSPARNSFINISVNGTDDAGLLTLNITMNLTNGILQINNSISGSSAKIHNITLLNETRGKVINVTGYVTDDSNNVVQSSTILTVANSVPIVLNITTLTPSPLSAGDTAKCHANYSDIDDDISGGNQTYWYINNTINNEANNSFTLGGKNLTLNSNITCSARFNDSIAWSIWVNSSMQSVGDVLAPSIAYANWSLASITGGSQINITVNASDNNLLDRINITARSPSGILFNRSCSSLNTNFYICNITFFDGDETAENGIWNLTVVSAVDNSLNSIVIYPNITMTVNPLSSGGSSESGSIGGGGGGGNIIEEVIILGNLSLILKPPIIDTYAFFCGTFKQQHCRYSITLTANKVLDSCISQKFECIISNNTVLVAINSSNSSSFISKVSSTITLIDATKLAKTIPATVRFINFGYAIPLELDIESKNYRIFELENNNPIGIRLWFVVMLTATTGLSIYVVRKYGL